MAECSKGSPGNSLPLGNAESISDPASIGASPTAAGVEAGAAAAAAGATASGRGHAPQGSSQQACRVPGCRQRLLLAYNQRHRICRSHQKAATIDIESRAWRFCQQCAKLQQVESFEGEKRSCRDSLDQQKARRQQNQPCQELLQGQQQPAQQAQQQEQKQGARGPSPGAITRTAFDAVVASATVVAVQEVQSPGKRARITSAPALPPLVQQPSQPLPQVLGQAPSMHILQQLNEQQTTQQLQQQPSSEQAVPDFQQLLRQQQQQQQTLQQALLGPSPPQVSTPQLPAGEQQEMAQLQQLVGRVAGHGTLHQPLPQHLLGPSATPPHQGTADMMDAFNHRLSRLEGQVQALLQLLMGGPPAPPAPVGQQAHTWPAAQHHMPPSWLAHVGQGAAPQQDVLGQALRGEGEDLRGGMLSIPPELLPFMQPHLATAQQAQQEQQEQQWHALLQQWVVQRAQQEMMPLPPEPSEEGVLKLAAELLSSALHGQEAASWDGASAGAQMVAATLAGASMDVAGILGAAGTGAATSDGTTAAAPALSPATAAHPNP